MGLTMSTTICNADKLHSDPPAGAMMGLMGDSCPDGSAAEVKEILDLMRFMAENALENFNHEIRRNQYMDPHIIPIKKILNSYQFIQCFSEDMDVFEIPSLENKQAILTSSTFADIKKMCGDFSHGPVAQGLAINAFNTIYRLINETSGVRHTKTTYDISVDPLGGISRLDTMYFVYNFKNKKYGKSVKSVVAACVVKSSANIYIPNFDDNTLRVLIERCFPVGDAQLMKAIYAEVYEAFFESDKCQYQQGKKKKVLAPEHPAMKTLGVAGNHKESVDVIAKASDIFVF